MSSPRSHTLIPNTDSRRRYISLCGVLSLLILLVAGLWYFWPQILMHSIRWQKLSVDYLSEQFYLPGATAKWTILGICLLYGVLHALGPGHGKVVVSTYLATHRTKLKTGIIITLISSLLQGVVAVVLVSVFLFVLHQSMHQLNMRVSVLIDMSGVFVALFGVYLLLTALKRGWQQQREGKRAHSHDNGKAAEHHDHHHHNSHHHEHHDHSCGCGHKHGANAQELNHASNWKEYLAIIVSIGFRPCSGAILVLFFAHLAQLYWVGIIGSVVMSLGTALTTSLIAFLTVSGRNIVHYYSHVDPHHSATVMTFLKCVAGILLITMGVILLQSPSYGISPMFS